MPSETVLFHLDDVLITDRRLTIHHQSFALQSILAIQLVEKGRRWLPAVLLGATALSLAYAGFAAGRPLLGVGAALMCALGALFVSHTRRCYALELDTEDGHFIPLRSRSRFLLTGLTHTLDAARRNLEVEPVFSVASHAGVPAANPTRVAIAEQTGWIVRPPKTGPVYAVPRELPAALLSDRRIATHSRRDFHPGKTG